jgi:hypothetical protein
MTSFQRTLFTFFISLDQKKKNERLPARPHDALPTVTITPAITMVGCLII